MSGDDEQIKLRAVAGRLTGTCRPPPGVGLKLYKKFMTDIVVADFVMANALCSTPTHAHRRSISDITE